jgi:hypothetical protein
MTILKQLSYAAMPTHNQMSPEQHRRNKLVTALNEQKAMAEASRDGKDLVVTKRRWAKAEDGTKQLVDAPKRLKRWWVNDSNGNCVLAVRYGNKVLELEKGKAAIVVGKPDKLIPTIEKVIAAVNAGELDTHLAQVGMGRKIRKPTK